MTKPAQEFGEHLLSTKQVAEIFGVSPRTLEQWRLKGRGPRFIRLRGQAVRYRPSALTEFLDRWEVSSTSDPGRGPR